VEALGDVLKRLDPRSKVIAMSGKDRGAILPAGKTGTAYMYLSSTGQFASSTYYMKEHPAWVNAFNRKHLAYQYFKKEWTALLPEAAYARSLPDNQPWFGPRFYGSLLRGPFADAMTLEFARAAIDGEMLGADDAPDILSGHDYVNHAFSAESRLSHDHFLQLDRMLQSFFQDLDTRVGKGNYMAVLTADHGFTPAVEYSTSQGLPTERISGSKALANIGAGLEAKFGPGKWVLGFSASSLLLNRDLLSQRAAERDAIIEEARRLLMAEPGAAATHGSPYANDTHVPILLYGPAWIGAGKVDLRLGVVDIAPTLATLLQVPAPSASEGVVLPLPKRQ
jgi:hypothetical protein